MTLALVAMVIVALSRPSSSEQNVGLLGQNNVPPGEASQPAPGEDPARSPSRPTDDSASATEKSGPDDPAPQVSTSGDSAPNNPAVPDPDPPPPEVPDNAQALDQARTESMSDDPPRTTEPPGTTPAADSATPDRGDQTADSADLPDPLRRLSFEFARRAAARERRAQLKATPAAPPADQIVKPSVHMSEGHRNSCLVFVGDALPDATLPDASGSPQQIHQQLGDKLTVVIFWNEKNPFSRDQFQQLSSEVVPFQSLGVQPIAIHVGPAPEDYVTKCEPYADDVCCLLDADGAYFAQVSKGPVPRTYVLDAQGKVIWLDIEYSRSTRYDLRNALHYSLRDQPATTPDAAADQ